MKLGPLELIFRIKAHVGILQSRLPDDFSVGRLALFLEELEAQVMEQQLKESIEKARTVKVIVPFPQNIALRHAGTVTEVSKRSPDSHLGAEGA